MSIRYIVGNPGSGKSYYGVKVLYDAFIRPKHKSFFSVMPAIIKAYKNNEKHKSLDEILKDNEKKDNSKTSEYFQYKGIEANLKETINGDKSIYQFRIGRITEQLIIIILFLCFHTLYRKEVYLCLRNALTLNERENLIYFTRIGAYKVSIVLYSYCKLSGQSFDEKKDLISMD